MNKSHGESKKQICKLLLLDLEDLVRQNCAPRMTDPAQNRLGARQQAAARWRNEDGRGVGNKMDTAKGLDFPRTRLQLQFSFWFDRISKILLLLHEQKN